MALNSLRCSSIAVVAIAVAMHISAAHAGTCAAEVEEFQKALPRDKNGELSFIGAAPQSISAQLEHQPTLKSVERAKRLSRSLIVTILAQATALDLESRPLECEDALGIARVLINP